MKRIEYIEVLRAIAMLMVITTHFIAHFCPAYFEFWQTYALFLKGISGKHGVAIFCVLIGYFASRNRNEFFPDYLTRRYLQFALNLLIVLLPFSIFLTPHFPTSLLHNIFLSLYDSIFLGNQLNSIFWCIRDMFFGSLLCWVLGNCCIMNSKRQELAFILALSFFMYFVDVWIAICCLGVAFRVFEQIKINDIKKITLCLLSLIAIPVLYRREECHSTYMLQGISCCLIMFVCAHVTSTKFGKVLPRLKFFTFWGNISFYMFLWHMPVFRLLSNIFCSNDHWLFLFVISFSISFILSTIQFWINNRYLNPKFKTITFTKSVK